MKHLIVRSGTYYVRATIRGKRYLRSTGITAENPGTAAGRDNSRTAREWRDRFLADVALARLDVDAGSRLRGGYPTLGELCERYAELARARGLVATTIAANTACLRSVVRRGLGREAVDDIRVDEALTKAVGDEYRRHVLDAAQDADRARRTIRSTLRQAKSVLARWVMDDYGWEMPDVGPFIRSGSVKLADDTYQVRPAALVQATLAGGRALAQQNPRLGVAYSLCYDAGLRSGEAVDARWDWIDETDPTAPVLTVQSGKSWTIGRRTRRIPLAPETVAEWRAAATQTAEYILAGDTRTSRETLIEDELASWMRGIGWDRAIYPKAAHELRKLFGARWYTERGPGVARDMLGHKTVTTTCKYYACLDAIPKALAR